MATTTNEEKIHDNEKARINADITKHLKPIIINPKLDEPLTISAGQIMCDKCFKIIRDSYLEMHRSSGACERNIEKNKLSEMQKKCKSNK